MHKICVYHACFTVVSVSYFSNVFVFDVVVSLPALRLSHASGINNLSYIHLVAKKVWLFGKKRVNIGNRSLFCRTCFPALFFTQASSITQITFILNYALFLPTQHPSTSLPSDMNVELRGECSSESRKQGR